MTSAASKFQRAFQRLAARLETPECPSQRQESLQPRTPSSMRAHGAAVSLAGLLLRCVAVVPRSRRAHHRWVEAGAAARFAVIGAATGEYVVVSPPATGAIADRL